MKTVVIFFAVILLAAIFSSDSSAITWMDDLDKAIAEANVDGRPVMVDFYTDWCGWCKKLDKDTYANPEVQELAGSFISVKVNGDRNRSVLGKYGVRGFPTIVFLDGKGSVIDKVVGYLGPQDMASRMKGVLAKAGQPRSGGVDKSMKAPAAGSARKGRFTLGGITYAGKSPRAIINDTVVKVGTEIDGAKVLEIKDDSVKLLVDGREVLLEMQGM